MKNKRKNEGSFKKKSTYEEWVLNYSSRWSLTIEELTIRGSSNDKKVNQKAFTENKENEAKYGKSQIEMSISVSNSLDYMDRYTSSRASKKRLFSTYDEFLEWYR